MTLTLDHTLIVVRRSGIALNLHLKTLPVLVKIGLRSPSGRCRPVAIPHSIDRPPVARPSKAIDVDPGIPLHEPGPENLHLEGGVDAAEHDPDAKVEADLSEPVLARLASIARRGADVVQSREDGHLGFLVPS